jgi:aryl-alcohol dehydrogenase-like predicted oxidoreductase
MFEEVSLAIPGAKNSKQAADNAAASGQSPLSQETMARVKQVYDTSIREQVHQRW